MRTATPSRGAGRLVMVTAAVALTTAALGLAALAWRSGQEGEEARRLPRFRDRRGAPHAAAVPPQAHWVTEGVGAVMDEAFAAGGASVFVPVVFVEEHHHALPYWYEAAARGLVRERDNALVHVDAHADTAPPPRGEPGQRPASPRSWNVDAVLANDEFIGAAVVSGLVSDVTLAFPFWFEGDVGDEGVAGSGDDDDGEDDGKTTRPARSAGSGSRQRVSRETVGRVRGAEWTLCFCRDRAEECATVQGGASEGGPGLAAAAVADAPPGAVSEVFAGLSDADSDAALVGVALALPMAGASLMGREDADVPASMCVPAPELRAGLTVRGVSLRRRDPLTAGGRGVLRGIRGGVGRRAIVDIDLDFFGTRSAAAALERAGLAGGAQLWLSWLMSHLSCPDQSAAGAERAESEAWRRLLRAPARELRNGTAPGLAALSPCAGRETSARAAGALVAAFLEAVRPGAAALAALDAAGPGCVQGRPVQGFGLCTGTPNTAEHEATGEDLALGGRALADVLRHSPAPGVVTVARSVRDGYTPAASAAAFERAAAAALAEAHPGVEFRPFYDPRLLGGAHGWDPSAWA